MKDNFNIEELFKEKFNSFEGDVSPNAWTTIQQGINLGTASSTATTTGISMALKVGLISGGIIAATAVGIYFGIDRSEKEEIAPIVGEEISAITEKNNGPSELIYVLDENDPVIEENRADLEREIQQINDFEEIEEEHTSSNQNSAVTHLVEEYDINETDELSSGTETLSGDNTAEEFVGTNKDDKDNSDTETKNESVSNNLLDKEVVAENLPTGKITYTKVSNQQPNDVLFNSNAKHFTAVKWNFGDGSESTEQVAEHTYTKPGEYTITLTVQGENEVYEEQSSIIVQGVSSIENIPNVFTPNGDQINDFFKIETTAIQEFFISIQDEKGTIVFKSNKSDFSWNGCDLGGNSLEQGRYTYIIVATGTDGKKFKLPGQIYIKR